MELRAQGAASWGFTTLTDPGPISYRLSFFPQMIADPIRGHPPGALMLVALSVGESAGKSGFICVCVCVGSFQVLVTLFSGAQKAGAALS